MLSANPPAVSPAMYIVINMSNTFFFPYKSDNLPATGVITAATIKYALKIHAAVPYGMLKSFMISGIAGKSIVSEKKTVRRVLLSIARVNHAWRLTVTLWVFI
ncbi:MAG TPA: hypothetical protein VE692_06815 [Nitrososphaera sp.]|nr:hypothetical protein [Nitrososphaera sp.]